MPLSEHRIAWAGYLASYILAAVANGDSLVNVHDAPALRHLRRPEPAHST